MVNIPLLTMDDYGLLEPTDVGTMTIDYDSKDDLRKRNRWDPEEVLCMLNLVKEHNYINKYPITKISNMVSQLMLKSGWNRTDRQVHLKLTAMRKNYLTFEHQRLMNGNLKECPFYKELRDIFRDANSSNGIDSEDYDTSSQDECLIKFPSDPVDWTKGEIQKMLNTIKSMKLKNELTLTFFSPVAVRMIAEAMQSAGFDRSTEQVKNALINLRTMYIDYKIGFDNNENPAECMFYSCLDLFWGKEYKKCRLKEKRKIRSDDSWSTEETIVLLTLIQDLNIADDAYKNTEKAAEDLRQSLAENGYSRSSVQVMNRLTQLKTDFNNVHTLYSEAEALQQFPFYNLYRKLFERQFSNDFMDQSNVSTDVQKDSLEYVDFCENAKQTSEIISRGTIWSKEEVKLLLKTVQEMTSGSQFNDSLEDEKLQKLVKVLSETGYHKTAEQIKQKLALLKKSYLRCNLEDSSEKDIFECPFYNELHNIFHTPISDERYEFIQSLLAEHLGLSPTKFADHSYTYSKLGNLSTESKENDKVTVVSNKSLDNWFPVESIIDENGVNASSTLDFNNLSTVSNKEQEQVIEDVLVSAFSNNRDTKNNNRTIAEDQKLPERKNVIVLEEPTLQPIPQSILNNVAIDQEITTTYENNDVNYSHIYKYNEQPDSTEKNTVQPADDDGPPPSKKPRIIEDEKIVGKNKFLLRPVEMKSSSLNNITNNKFVRLIVANEPNKSRVNHITAHIEPMNINTASSVSSGMSSPVERADILKIATEKAFTKEDFDMQKFETEKETGIPKTNSAEYLSQNKSVDTSVEAKISATIKEAVQSMMKHDEIMQEKHHEWMEKQFEIQRKHDEDQKLILMNELKELRSVITVVLANKQPHVNNQNR